MSGVINVTCVTLTLRTVHETHLSRRQLGHVLCLGKITMVPGQPAGFFKEVCLYSGTDWLKVLYQSEDGEGS